MPVSSRAPPLLHTIEPSVQLFHNPYLSAGEEGAIARRKPQLLGRFPAGSPQPLRAGELRSSRRHHRHYSQQYHHCALHDVLPVVLPKPSMIAIRLSRTLRYGTGRNAKKVMACVLFAAQ